MTRTLVTGGNKGLGYETARRLKDLGHEVVIGARDEERGRRAAEALGVERVLLDVRSDASVATAAAELRDRFGVVDVLVNNAGVSGGTTDVEALTGSAALEVLDTNTLSVVRTVHAFLPLLRRSAAPVIVNVTSGLGSFALRLDESRFDHDVPSMAYSASKAAVNMLTVLYARFLPDLRINAVDPGFTATDLNGGSGSQSVEEGTDVVVRMACIGPDGPTGTLSDRDGQEPW